MIEPPVLEYDNVALVPHRGLPDIEELTLLIVEPQSVVPVPGGVFFGVYEFIELGVGGLVGLVYF